MSIQTSPFIDRLEKKYPWFAIENLGLFLVILQAFGFVAVHISYDAIYKFALIPSELMRGELWRLFTFIALPLSTRLWIILLLFFLYQMMQLFEQLAGSFKTTLYFSIGLVMTILYSVTTGFVVTTFMPLEMTLIFAVAALYPEMELMLFFMIPVRIMWIALFGAALLLFTFIFSPWAERGFLFMTYLNYLIFFGPGHFEQLKRWRARRDWKP